MIPLDRRRLSVEDAAKATGRSRRTVERWISDGRLPAQTIGRKRYVKELDALVVERDTRNAAKAGRPGARTTKRIS